MSRGNCTTQAVFEL